jgi:tetratricopeptide (TPR) repeat protein
MLFDETYYLSFVQESIVFSRDHVCARLYDIRPVLDYGPKLLLIVLLSAEVPLAAFFAEGDADAEAHFRKAAALAQQGKIKDAEREYITGLRISPQSGAAYNNLGALYFQQQQFARAADAFGKARRLLPSDREIAFNLGLSLYKRGDAAGAISHLELGQSSHHALDAGLLLGICYFATRQWQKSIGTLEQYRKHIPDNPQVLFILEQAYAYAGDAKSSLDRAAELLKSHPDSSYTHQMLAEAYDRDGDVEHAAEEFRLAIACQPAAPQLHFMLGYVYWRWKRYAEAESPLKTETRMNPGFAPSYFYLGDLAFRKKDTASALELFQKALDLDPSYNEARLGLGKSYVQAGKLSEGIAALRTAEVALDKTTPVHYWLGRALIQEGRTEEGQKELAKVKELSAVHNQKMQETLNGAPVGERFQLSTSH